MKKLKQRLVELRYHHDAVPRLHGNGFIQLDIDADRRLHIWPYPEFTGQRRATQIHNHTFGFESQVLRGRTLNVAYDVFHVGDVVRWSNQPAYYVIHEAQPREREDTVLVPIRDRPLCMARRRSVELLETGDRYTFAPLAYHEHLPTRGTVVTLMKKTVKLEGFLSRVLVPALTAPDNEFNRYQVPAEALWELVFHATEGLDDIP